MDAGRGSSSGAGEQPLVRHWWRAILSFARTRVSALAAADATMLLWSLAHVGLREDLPLLSALAAHIQGLVPQLKQQVCGRGHWPLRHGPASSAVLLCCVGQ